MTDERFINAFNVAMIEKKAEYMHFFLEALYSHLFHTANNDHKSQLIKKAIYEQKFYDDEKQPQKPSNSPNNHNAMNNNYHAQNNTNNNFNNTQNQSLRNKYWKDNYNQYLPIRDKLLHIITTCPSNKGCSKRYIFAQHLLSTETITDISTTLEIMLAEKLIQTTIDKDHYKTTFM